MSFRILLTCLVCFLQAPVLSDLHAQSLKGKWQGEKDGEVGMMNFDKKGFITFVINNEEIGGERFMSEGIEMTMRYDHDDKAEPHTLDFILTMADDGMELIRMLGIYKFLDSKTLVINMDFDGNDRPKEFDDDDENQVTLSKVK